MLSRLRPLHSGEGMSSSLCCHLSWYSLCLLPLPPQRGYSQRWKHEEWSKIFSLSCARRRELGLLYNYSHLVFLKDPNSPPQFLLRTLLVKANFLCIHIAMLLNQWRILSSEIRKSFPFLLRLNTPDLDWVGNYSCCTITTRYYRNHKI